MAIWARVWPRRRAISFRPRTLARFASVSSSRRNEPPRDAREPAGTPAR